MASRHRPGPTEAAYVAVWMREAATRRHVETLRNLRMTPGTRDDQVAYPLERAFADSFAGEAQTPT